MTTQPKKTNLIRLMEDYPEPKVKRKLGSMMIDDARVISVHEKEIGFVKTESLAQRRWFKRLAEAPEVYLNHRYYYVRDKIDGIQVYAMQNMKDKKFYDWYDMAWNCTEIGVNVLDRKDCPDVTQ